MKIWVTMQTLWHEGLIWNATQSSDKVQTENSNERMMHLAYGLNKDNLKHRISIDQVMYKYSNAFRSRMVINNDQQ